MKKYVLLSILVLSICGTVICYKNEFFNPNKPDGIIYTTSDRDKSSDTSSVSDNIDLTKTSFSNKELQDMAIVDKEINKWLDENADLPFNKKKSELFDFLVNLSINGTKDHNYSLIEEDSIYVNDSTASFQNISGARTCILLDELDSSCN